VKRREAVIGESAPAQIEMRQMFECSEMHHACIADLRVLRSGKKRVT
jgi:hypothetical protein